ncbi:unnamed protein product [Zymoseptoria tritici ST99CH_3D7]|uniref:Apple domain-containing protein n=1 Tax=Zymoseptoria tritici (strain ST99CH_3D7) TaxID=1276538 RepID=A0A1X7RL97_ZYMT9|nr:unnamed protein product [Zymoseptoria tritici ST99CH_3D7]
MHLLKVLSAAPLLLQAAFASPTQHDERSASICGSVGYDQGKFLLNKPECTIAQCSDLCKKNINCKSYGYGKRTCRLYSKCLKDTVKPSKGSPYSFYDRACPCPSAVHDQVYYYTFKHAFYHAVYHGVVDHDIYYGIVDHGIYYAVDHAFYYAPDHYDSIHDSLHDCAYNQHDRTRSFPADSGTYYECQAPTTSSPKNAFVQGCADQNLSAACCVVPIAGQAALCQGVMPDTPTATSTSTTASTTASTTTASTTASIAAPTATSTTASTTKSTAAAVPTSVRLRLTALDGSDLGYVTNTFSLYGHRQATNDVSQALIVSYDSAADPLSQLDLTNMNSATYTDLPYLSGNVGSASSNFDNLGPGNNNGVLIGASLSTPPGERAKQVDNSYGRRLGGPRNCESAIWEIDPTTNALRPVWINTDGSKPTVFVLLFGGVLLFTGDVSNYFASNPTGTTALTIAIEPIT